jgi:glutaminyl-peptide cyclotransferase
MLTWKEKTMLIYEKQSLQLLSKQLYETHTGQGWGIAYDGTHMIISDGSHFLMFYEMPSDASSKLVPVKKIRVIDPETDTDVRYINELEYVDGFVYANIWYKDTIIKIDPKTGTYIHIYNTYTYAYIYIF